MDRKHWTEMRHIFATLAFIFLAKSSYAELLIHNGNKLKSSQIPQMQALFITDDEETNAFSCSATLIGPKVIVTASHCIKLGDEDYKPTYKFGPILGEYYNVKFFKDPFFDRSIDLPNSMAGRYDISFGILEKEVMGVVPISVTDVEPKIGDKILMAGLGQPLIEIRQYGYGQIIEISNLGITIQGQGETPSVAGSGDSGGANLSISTDGAVKYVATISTSSGTEKERIENGWTNYPLYTTGGAKILPTVKHERFIDQIARENKVEICGLNIVCERVYFK